MKTKLFAAAVVSAKNEVLVKFFCNPENYTDTLNRNSLIASSPKNGFWAKNAYECNIHDLGYADRVPAAGDEHRKAVDIVESFYKKM